MSSKLTVKLKDLIEKNALSVQGLERKAGLKIHAVRNILTGQTKKPSAETLLAVSKALDCSISDLLDEVRPRNENRETIQEIVFHKIDLLQKIIPDIIEFHQQNTLPLTNCDLMEAIEQIYTYSLKNNNGDYDSNFAKWFLERKL
tara:strand:+ start:1239 stop:1673 length:435 start_codon:yes stop_codon:yes gene_type:complete